MERACAADFIRGHALSFGRPLWRFLQPEVVLLGYSVRLIGDPDESIESNFVRYSNRGRPPQSFSIRTRKSDRDTERELYHHALDVVSNNSDPVTNDEELRRRYFRLNREFHELDRFPLRIVVDGAVFEGEAFEYNELTNSRFRFDSPKTVVTISAPTSLYEMGFTAKAP